MSLPPAPSRALQLAPVFIVIAALMAHGTMLLRGFVWDDRISIAQMALQGRWLLFEPDAFGFVRPGKTMLLSLLDALFGGTAVAWHGFALLTLVLAGLAIWRLALEFLSPAGALVAALVYTVHPFHVEATGWISALNGTWLAIVAVAYYMVLLGDVRSPRPMGAFTLTALFLIALFFKEEAVVLPIAGLLLLWLQGDRPRLVHLGAMAAQYALAGAFILYNRLAAAQVGQVLEPLPYAGWIVSLTAPRTVASHFAYFVFPFQWAYRGTFNPDPRVYMPLLGLGWVLAGSLAWWAWRRRNSPGGPLVFVLFAVVGLLPTANLLPMGNDQFAPRYLAHAGIGLCLLVGWTFDRWDSALWVRGLLAGWLVGATVASAAFHLPWRSEEAFYTRMIRETRSGAFPLLLAQIRIEQGRLDEAAALANDSIALRPEHADGYITLGRIHRLAGRNEEAIAAWRRAEELDPGNIDLSSNLGDYFDTRFSESNDPGDFEKADGYYAQAQRGLGPNAEVAFVNRGLLWIARDPARGIAIWREGLAKFPQSRELQQNLAIAARSTP